MAGLLDYLYDPSTYGGDNGLLSRIKAGALFDNPNPPQQQTPPIPVGGVQMPRMGAPDQYQPQQPQPLPPGIANAQAQAPQEAPQGPQSAPAFTQADQPGFMSFYQNMRGGGGLIGSIAAGLTGQRTDPTGIQQQNMNAQFKATREALIANGVPERQATSTAYLSVLNPEAAKTVLPEMLTNKVEWGVVNEDPLEGKKYGWIDKLHHTINGQAPGQAPGQVAGQPQGLQATVDAIAAKRMAGASREDLLKFIPPGYRDDVDAMLSGKSIPANLGRSQLRGPLITLAHAVDSSFDETKLPAIIQTRKDFAPGGKDAASIGAFNTVQHHIGKLSDDLEGLSKYEGGWSLVNTIKNGAAVNTPYDPARGKAVQAVQDDLKAVTDEMSAAYKAGHVSDTEIASWNKLANANLPPPIMRQAIADFVGLLNGKRDALNKIHQQMIGSDAPTIDREHNETITKKVNERNAGIESGGSSSAPAINEGMTATNPQTGQKIVFKGGRWVPAQ